MKDCKIPTQQIRDIVSTFKQRKNVTSTLKQRLKDVICLLGMKTTCLLVIIILYYDSREIILIKVSSHIDPDHLNGCNTDRDSHLVARTRYRINKRFEA